MAAPTVSFLLQEIIKNQILATDISRQSEFLALLKRYQETGELDMSQKKYRHFVLQIAVKCADISNPCRAWNISRLWSYRACEEFFRQGDRERVLGFQPVTSFCDRNNITVAKVHTQTDAKTPLLLLVVKPATALSALIAFMGILLKIRDVRRFEVKQHYII